MKKLILLILIVLTLQVKGQYSDQFKLYPIDFYYNSAKVGWVHKEGVQAISIMMGLPISGEAKHNWFIVPSNLRTYSCEFAYCHYFNKLYLETDIASRTYDFNNNQSIGTTQGYLYTTTLGIKTGIDLVVNKRIVINFFVGGEFGNCNGSTESIASTMLDVDNMLVYITQLTQKLPKRADPYIIKEGRNIKARVEGFTFIRPTGGMSIGILLHK
jgi:hypothetical protein